ncbi:MAG: tRNA pseudouridine(55) synthase TruB [Planctomycetes bacterium]|nr:tRNA pseudouridine(55) synthase TruB [Planctomycetota bacterium]
MTDSDFGNRVLLIDKDSGWTSHDVCNYIKSRYKVKVGHAGTLDPMATGLLIVLTGKETKNARDYEKLDKEYMGTLKLGETTPSDDAETEVSAKANIDGVAVGDLEKAFASFIGEIDQVPPMYSAIKKEGRKLYHLARKGEVIEREPRRIRIDELEVTEIDMPFVSFRCACSKGTYIRALARDIGDVLGVGAHLTALRRTAIGDLRVEDAFHIDKSI